MSTYQSTLLPFKSPSSEKLFAAPGHASPQGAGELAASYSMLELDREIDDLLDLMQDELEEEGTISQESKAAFEMFCAAFGEKVDRIGRFLGVLETRAAYCENEAARLLARARIADTKEKSIKSLVLYYLQSRDLKKIEGSRFTLSCRKNSQDSLRLDPDVAIPMHLESVSLTLNGAVFEQVLALLPDELSTSLAAAAAGKRSPSTEAIRAEIAGGVTVEGATLTRGFHLRVS